jgi:methionyl-tRNA synthetase
LRMRGEDVFFQVGTDENGLKIKEAAEKEGRDPHEFVAEIAGRFKTIFDATRISYDDFIRTTEPRHIKASQALFRKLEENGHVFLGTYEGWYDVSTETFFREEDLVDGKSPDGNEVRWVSEENYFFRLSSFSDQLLAHIEANPNFIVPANRKNEVVSFIKQGLRDISITRKNPGWGIPVPGREDLVIYVWFDALINYIASTGWPDEGWQEKWPAKVQWVGKDILTRFHATLWPAMLLGIGLPLFETVAAHGWVLLGGEKISKSKGNVVRPLELAEEFSAKAGISNDLAIDVLRHYLTATMSMEGDSTFTYEDFDQRYNSDLANDLGNALNRSLSMAHKFGGGVVPHAVDNASLTAEDKGFLGTVEVAKDVYANYMESYRIPDAVESAWSLVSELNRYIDARKPWELAQSDPKSLRAVIRCMLMQLRAIEGLIRPTVPVIADAIASQLNLPGLTSWEDIGSDRSLPGGTILNAPEPLFPRLQVEKAVAQQLLASGELQEVLHVLWRDHASPIKVEFDIVARKDDVIAVIEVKKTQINTAQGKQILDRMKLAALDALPGQEVKEYIYLIDQQKLFEFDAYLATAQSSKNDKALVDKPIKKEKMENQTQSKTEAESKADQSSSPITIEDFMKVDLRVARVIEAEPVEGSDKLLKLQLDIAGEKRQVVAGIKANYQPLDLIGRQVVMVFNLKPAKLRGVESQGMLLAALDAEGGAILLQPDKETPEGSKVR